MKNTITTIFRMSIMIVITTIIFAACQQDKPTTDKQRAPTPKTETPCKGEVVLRHAYSECQDDGFWHVVEDNYIVCKEDNTERKFRVRDFKTTQPCNSIPRPSVAGNGYTLVHVDTVCLPVGRITISECESGMWVEKKYDLSDCPGGLTIQRTLDSTVATLVPCYQSVPRPTR